MPTSHTKTPAGRLVATSLDAKAMNVFVYFACVGLLCRRRIIRHCARLETEWPLALGVQIPPSAFSPLSLAWIGRELAELETWVQIPEGTL